MKRIMTYLKGTRRYGLLYSESDFKKCVGYSDADWAGDVNDFSLEVLLRVGKVENRQV